jgi:hypothetical protein
MIYRSCLSACLHYKHQPYSFVLIVRLKQPPLLFDFLFLQNDSGWKFQNTTSQALSRLQTLEVGVEGGPIMPAPIIVPSNLLTLGVGVLLIGNVDVSQPLQLGSSRVDSIYQTRLRVMLLLPLV